MSTPSPASDSSQMHLRIVSREEWLSARKAFLVKEKALVRERDRVNAERRQLPVVRIEKEYLFEGADGRVNLLDLFEGRNQLIVYHFMFDPEWDEGCSGCSSFVDDIGHLAHLHARNTSFVLVSRAPFAKLNPFRERMGWSIPWYSSFGSDFNYDFHVTLDEAVAPVEYNYKTKLELKQKGDSWFTEGEVPGLSIFLQREDQVFHTYSTYSRGADMLGFTSNFLDLTLLGRQEDWEDSPAGWPQTPTHDWVRFHDRY